MKNYILKHIVWIAALIMAGASLTATAGTPNLPGACGNNKSNKSSITQITDLIAVLCKHHGKVLKDTSILVDDDVEEYRILETQIRESDNNHSEYILHIN